MERLSDRIQFIRKQGGYVLHVKDGDTWTPVEVDHNVREFPTKQEPKWWQFWK